MSKESIDKNKLREYQERYRFWTDKRISQLSFHNNLLLTLGFAIVGFFWAKRYSIYTNLAINTGDDIDWIVLFFVAGSLALFISIILGFLLSVSRLYDLRLTSNIALTRKWALKEDVTIKDEILLHSKFIDIIKNIIEIFRKFSVIKINKRDITNDEKFQEKFKNLRQKSHDIGNSTWCLLKWQTSFMLIGMTLFIILMVLK